MEKTKNTKNAKTIIVAGKEYPYVETMGALLDFQDETGKLEPAGLAENLKYIYCVVRSVCRRNGQEFTLTFQEFVDALDPAEFDRLIKAISADNLDKSTDHAKKV